MYYLFIIERFTVSAKVLNAVPKRGTQVAASQLRLNLDIDRIVAKTSVADLATAYAVTGGTPDGKDTSINLKNYGYSYADPKTGDVYSVDASTGQMRKDVDFIVGTNSDEWRYWVDEMSPESVIGPGDAEAVESNLEAYKVGVAQVKYDDAIAAADNDAEKAAVDKVLKLSGEKELWWQQTEVGNETGFRIPSIVCAQNHAQAVGNTYMYYFQKKADIEEWLGACHASETAYVFHNLTGAGFSGTMDEDLADSMCAAWVSFATDGNPSIDSAEWPKYEVNNRTTMIFGDDGSLKTEDDPLGEQRELMENFAYDYLK